MSAIDYLTGYLMAFGAMVALARRVREGGSWLVRISLAQTGRWLVGRGQVPEAKLEDVLTRRFVSPNWSAMSHTGTSGPMKLPEWITGRSGVLVMVNGSTASGLVTQDDLLRHHI